MLLFSSLLGISIGIIIAVQTAINSSLRSHLHSPFLTATVSFSIGTLCLSAACLLTGQPLPSIQILGESAWWLWIGGALGVLELSSIILIFQHLGAVQTAVMPILGQIVMGLFIDQLAWFHVKPQPLTALKLIGLCLALIGIFLAVVWTNRHNPANPTEQKHSAATLWLWRLLGIMAGMLMTIQAAINGQLGVWLHSPLLAALWAFTLGSLILWTYILCIEHSVAQIGKALKLKMPIIFWSGGALGALCVFGNTLLLPRIGAGQTVILMLLGMIIGSLCLEHFGLLGAKRKTISHSQISGLLCLLLGVAMIRLF